ncbi:MAG: RpiB/LacA/LacB family sugar-phosphate isomerase [Acetobacteraceae bacterium]|nr:RpiB/LacA/LacB family sugar-phosphate isomerase [Acetobacteraceae bacterium]
MKLVLAGDSAGKPLVDIIAAHLAKRPDVTLIDLSKREDGVPEPYAFMTERAAQAVLDGRAERGIFCCGTGIGVCISANKIPGIRAALTHDTYSAERAAKSNNAQVITMGARVIGPELAKTIVDTFLASNFDPNGPSGGNVGAIDDLDRRTRKAD